MTRNRDRTRSVSGCGTGGGAHPTRGFQVSGAVHMSIPFARSVNPVTGTNWEGTGVTPDVAVPEAEACDVAYAKALRHVLAAADVPPPVKDEAREALARLDLPGHSISSMIVSVAGLVPLCRPSSHVTPATTSRNKLAERVGDVGLTFSAGCHIFGTASLFASPASIHGPGMLVLCEVTLPVSV
jgi:hypothetical protein